MRWLPVLMMSLCVWSLQCADVADETVRYVNDQIISLGDVFQRNQERLSTTKGTATPSGMVQWMAYSKVSLEELTDEELLIQYAKDFAEQHKFQLLDHEHITQMVLERARSMGKTMTLHEQALQRKAIERRQSIEFIMGFLEMRAASIGPVELMQDYQNRAKDFYRPPRAKVMEIVLRPTGVAEKLELKQAKQVIFKRCQDAADAVIKKTVDSKLDAYLAGSPDEQERILTAVVTDIAAMATRTDMDAATTELVRNATKAVQGQVKLRDADATFKELGVLRSQLDGKDQQFFKTVAQANSQGPGASDGGDRGWLEPGTEGKDFDQVVFALKAGELSPVFRSGDVSHLVLVTETVAARSREFSEVTAEIEAGLKPKRLQELRREAVAMLRAKASIRDVATLEKLRE